jgi:hypothetical protein
MNEQELLASLQLLVVAGYETTVNSITNGMLTLLRHPDVLARLRRDPDMVIRTVEEVLRYEPPVHIRTRTTLANSKSGCFMAKPTINGAMTKAAALSPVVRLNTALSILRMSLRNRFIQDILYLSTILSLAISILLL